MIFGKFRHFTRVSHEGIFLLPPILARQNESRGGQKIVKSQNDSIFYANRALNTSSVKIRCLRKRGNSSWTYPGLDYTSGLSPKLGRLDGVL